MFDVMRAVSVREMCNILNISCHHNSLPTHLSVRCGSTSLIDYLLFSFRHPRTFFTQDNFRFRILLVINLYLYSVIDINVPSGNEFDEYFDFIDIDFSSWKILLILVVLIGFTLLLLWMSICTFMSDGRAVLFKRHRACKFNDDT